MARGRKKKIDLKYYDELIALSKNDLQKLENNVLVIKEEIKSKKNEIKKLEKEKASYEEQKRLEKEQNQIREIAEKILTSNKSFDEIEKFLTEK